MYTAETRVGFCTVYTGSMDQVAVELNALLGWLRTFNLSSEVSKYVTSI
jgi:hypothetical protein